MYVKLYSSIVTSSIWSEDAATCKVWITLLALADRAGFVFGSPSGLARIAAVPTDEVKSILVKFKEPDPESSDLVRNPSGEGRRILEIDGGWQILNYEHYRDMRDADTRREQTRDAVRKHRKQMKASVSPSEAEAESYSESDTEKEPKREGGHFVPPTLAECEEFFEKGKLDGSAKAFFYHFEEAEWKRGKGKPVKDWRLTARKWSANESQFSTARGRQGTNGTSPAVFPPVNGPMPSGDYRLPTGGYAAADLSWFDYKGERYFERKPGVYRNEDGYAPDGTHQQNVTYGPGAKAIADRILAAVPVKE